MGRKADTTRLLEIHAEDVHLHDVLVGADGRTFFITERHRTRDTVRVEVYDGHAHRRFQLPVHRLVRVQVEHDCQCSGTGVFRGGGVVENGRYRGFSGVCFGCSGKGWQNRSDVIRNHTYWAKYARISA